MGGAWRGEIRLGNKKASRWFLVANRRRPGRRKHTINVYYGGGAGAVLWCDGG